MDLMEPRAGLPHEIVEHRLATRIAKLAGHLPKPRDGIDGSSTNRPQIQSLNGSTFDPDTARSYVGGASYSIALEIMSRCAPSTDESHAWNAFPRKTAV
jgi:hypothetical protein